MAVKYLSHLETLNINMQGYELQNAVIHTLTNNTRPVNPNVGQVMYNTDNQTLELWDGVNWSSVSGDITSITITTGVGLQGGVVGVTGAVTGSISLNHLGLEDLVDPNKDSIFYWNDLTKKSEFLDIGDGLLINSGVLSNTIINNDQLINGSGYITADSSDTLTNKSGNISQWTNDVGYITDGNTNWNNTYGFITGINWDEITGNQLDINLSGFNNDSGFTTFDGDYNSLSNLPTIPTNNNQLINGAGYITTGNDGWVNTYGFITGVNWDEIGGLQSDINLSGFTNDVGFVSGDEFDSSGTYLNLRAQATTKGDVGLGNVENISLSTYTGNGGSLDNQYIINSEGYITGINWDGIGGTQSDINLSGFTNDVGFSTFDGDYNSLTNIPTYTQGSIIFADSDGSLTENNTQLYWDNINNRLGIGTNSPTEKLDIKGNVKADGILKLYDVTDTQQIELNPNGDSYINGYLGIGTSFTDTPQAVLHIQDVNPRIIRLQDRNYSNTYADIDFKDGSLKFLTDPQQIRVNSLISFSIDNLERLRINYEGNVGIGTTSPTYKLELNGSTPNERTIGIDGDAVLYYPDQSIYASSIAIGDGLRNQVNVLVNDGTRNIAIGRGSQLDVTTGNSNVSLGSNTLENNLTGNGNTAVGHLTMQNMGSNSNTAVGFGAMRFVTGGLFNVALGNYAGYEDKDDNPIITVNRSVYIGAGSKSFATSNVTNEIVIGHDAVGKGSNTVVLGNDDILQTYLKGLVNINDSLRLFDTTDTQTIELNPNGDSYVNGNLGIGTTSPSKALDIVAINGQQFRLTQTTADNTRKNAYINVRHYNNSEEDFTMFLGNSDVANNNLNIGGGTTIGNSATVLRFYTAANTTTTVGTVRMLINSSGNVGINKTTPTEILDVNGNIKADGTLKLFDITNTQTIELNPDGDSYINGKLAVGRDNPTYNLHVNGDIGFSGNKIYFETDLGGSQTLQIGSSNIADSFLMSRYLRLTTNSQGVLLAGIGSANNTITIEGENGIYLVTDINRVFIDSIGRVGLNTLTPTERLDVVGNIKSSGYITGKRCGAAGYLASPVNITVTTANTYYPIGVFTVPVAADFIVGTTYPNGLKYTGTIAQTFHITWNATVESTSNNVSSIIDIEKNGVSIPMAKMGTYAKTGGEIYNLSGQCVVDLDTNDEVRFVVTADNNGEVLTFDYFAASIKEFFD